MYDNHHHHHHHNNHHHNAYKHVPSSTTLSELTTNDLLAANYYQDNSDNTSSSSASSTPISTQSSSTSNSETNSVRQTIIDDNNNIQTPPPTPTITSTTNINYQQLNENRKLSNVDYDNLQLKLLNSNEVKFYPLEQHIDEIPRLKRFFRVFTRCKCKHYNKYHLNHQHSNCSSNLSSSSSSSDANLNAKAVSTKRAYFVIIILFIVNLLNYIDRYTIAGVLREIQAYYKINDSMGGLLQTVFICSYMLLAPLFGYLGDRYNRKIIIIFGVVFWSCMTLAGSFVPREHFWLFAIIRSLVGVGEASYSCVTPTIIGDLFTNELRTRMLGIFFLAVPIGSGLGYIIGSKVAMALNDWRWALRVTPPLGLICIVLLAIFVEEPKRGGAEGIVTQQSKTNVLSDVVYLLKNKTYMLTTMGFTFASFVLGGLSWWVPVFVEAAIYSSGRKPDNVALYFGLITCVAGLVGVCLASIISQKLRLITKSADPLLCALGSLIAVPALFVAILIPRVANLVLYWFVVAIGISSMCLCWTLVADITLYVIQPTRRSMASALNILICHLLGDAISPYIIGAISDALRASKVDSYYARFTSLQAALYAGPFFAALSFAAYLFAALYVDDDKKKVELFIKKQEEENRQTSSSLDENSTLDFDNSRKELAAIQEQTIDETTVKSTNTTVSTQPSSLSSPQQQQQQQQQHQQPSSNAFMSKDDRLAREAYDNKFYANSNANTMTNLTEASDL